MADYSCELRTVDRKLTHREREWIAQILNANEEWTGADLTHTRVVAEGPCDEGYLLRFHADAPQFPHPRRSAGIVGNLWIELSDGEVINSQLFHDGESLSEMYVLFVYRTVPGRSLFDEWQEVRRQAVGE